MVCTLSILPCKMSTNNKLMDMLTGYAASHQHPFNIFVHMIGIPTIMLGVLIPLTMLTIEIDFEPPLIRFLPAYFVVVGFFLFYLTLDAVFAFVFLLFGIGLTLFARWIVDLESVNALIVAAVCFFGGYALQFVGHAVEKSMPVLVKHPIQANLAAPFFTVVEAFKLLGLREGLFNAVQAEIAARRESAAG